MTFLLVKYKDTLFNIYTAIGSITAKERARITDDRLKELYHQYSVKSDSLLIVNSGSTVELIYKDRVVVTVTDLDGFHIFKAA